MPGAMFILGFLSLVTPVAMMVQDGVRPGDDDNAVEEWFIQQPLHRLMMIRAFMLGGVMMLFSGVALAAWPI